MSTPHSFHRCVPCFRRTNNIRRLRNTRRRRAPEWVRLLCQAKAYRGKKHPADGPRMKMCVHIRLVRFSESDRSAFAQQEKPHFRACLRFRVLLPQRQAPVRLGYMCVTHQLLHRKLCGLLILPRNADHIGQMVLKNSQRLLML